jgi:hypothetical protein
VLFQWRLGTLAGAGPGGVTVAIQLLWSVQMLLQPKRGKKAKANLNQFDSK